MTELETLLLQQLEQQQRDFERLLSGLSEHLERLQTALSEQQRESRALRRELEQSDQQNAAALERLTERVEACTRLLNSLEMPSNR